MFNTIPPGIVHAFNFQHLSGQALQGSPDEKLFEEAINRFKHARIALKGQELSILEFPFSSHKHIRPGFNNVFVRYDAKNDQYEIKVFKIGHYRTRQLIGHFILTGGKPEIRYDTTIS